MKKLILLSSAVLLLAAGCNNSAKVSQQKPGPSAEAIANASGKADDVVKSLDKSSKDEQTTVQASDNSDVFNSDSAELNGYMEVSNESY